MHHDGQKYATVRGTVYHQREAVIYFFNFEILIHRHNL